MFCFEKTRFRAGRGCVGKGWKKVGMEGSGGLGFCFEEFDDRLDVGGVGKGSRVKGSSFLTRSFGMTGDWSCLVTLIEDPGTEDVTLGLVSIQMVINVTRMKDPRGRA